MNKNVFALISLGLLMAAPLRAQEQIVVRDTVGVKVYFHQGKTNLDTVYHDNGRRLREFAETVKQMRSNPDIEIESVNVAGGASPEGSATLNQQLSEGRAKRIIEFLEKNTDIPTDQIKVYTPGVDWDGLYERILSSDMEYRDEMADIVLNTPVLITEKGRIVGGRLNSMQTLHGGRPYRWLLENVFPELRASSFEASIITRQILPAPEPEPEPEPVIMPEPVVIPEPEPEPEPVIVAEPEPEPEKDPFYWYVKTNMLYDAILIPNIGVEFYLGNNWSLGGNWMYEWLKNDNTHYYWRVYGGDFHVSRWFGKAAEEKPLTGHHMGVYGGIVTYDFEWGGRGYLGPKWSYGGGVEYGYSKPIGKRLNIDFTIGIGYLGGKYYEYLPIDQCYVWQCTKNRNFIGPTKLEVNLVWQLGRGNVNKKYVKGGEK